MRLNWLDEDFLEHEEEYTGFLARIIQHEFDHLEGKVYIDRVSPIRRQLNRAKLNNIVQGKVSTDYPVRTAPRRRRWYFPHRRKAGRPPPNPPRAARGKTIEKKTQQTQKSGQN